ncbi:MAG TPA: phosphoribosylaminoimidazolesuccinocarboxamide synthase, partial [Syntrophorhabdaceae bacterium]|nr:phosphoribosylaminoimidazolesuccinocarboxamide synthase [Syntrophorhabdaceae bacterium]
EEGHDLNISFEEAVRIIGDDYARHLKDSSIAIYEKARGLAETRGIIVADTKFEFGVIEGDVVLIDEVLTPDSSRFWSIKDYAPGKPQDSYDKQIVRDYLNTLDWGKTYPGPELPPEIAKKASERYKEIYAILTGEKI